MQTKTLSERIEELLTSDVEMFERIDELENALLTVVQDNAISYDANARLKKENEALLAKNKELEEELQERKAYIVANPCAQCGGKINAMKCEAWAKKAKELEEKLKNNDMSKPEPKIKTGTMTASEVSKAWENFDKRFKEDMKETIKSIEKLLIDRQLSPLTQNRS